MVNYNRKPFIFDTELRLVMLMGLKAHSLLGLRRAMKMVPDSSVFFHTHQAYLAHDFQRPSYCNDFSTWISQVIREEALAEKIAAIDLLAFTSIQDLRNAIVKVIDDYVTEESLSSYECKPNEAFHFCRSTSFVLPTGIVAHDVQDFFEKLKLISNASLYFHFFEARLKLGRRTNDLSHWLRARNRDDLASAIDALNPYTRTLDEFKQDIIAVGQDIGTKT
jgi:hypothetical protein